MTKPHLSARSTTKNRMAAWRISSLCPLALWPSCPCPATCPRLSGAKKPRPQLRSTPSRTKSISDILRPRFGDFLGEIGHAGGRFTYPLGLTVADQFVSDRVALVGDAAHGMHPIAGQGLNAGLRDVGALVQVLTEARRRGEDEGTLLVLRRYEEWRRFDTSTMVAATDLSNKLFSNDNPLLRLGRDIGMGLINRSPALRRNFIREAAGLKRGTAGFDALGVTYPRRFWARCLP